MALNPGTKLGPYEIQSPLGAGGMGEVYRARDGRLGRDIALKILPQSFARDDERLHRFEQESLAVAALNHPNILAIYDVGQHDGVPFLISELLEGESLRVVLDRGTRPQRKVIDYGVQIAQGLAAAHDKGIVHRDLKPENLFLTTDGRIKILDFGLAKLASQKSPEPDATRAHSHTQAGVVMGTAGYMAPEQVQGKAVDARTDIFALGAVLFEMLSGKPLFLRETVAETMTAVLKDDVPELPVLQPAVSPALDRIVRRCLEKNPEERFQSARDLSFALGVLSGSQVSGAARAEQSTRNKWLWGALPLLLLLVAAAGWHMSRKGAIENRLEFAIPVPGEVSHLNLSPDGRMLAFVSPDEKTGAPMLFVQLIGTPSATELAGTEGASYPFWSPDDAYVAFFANGKLQKIAATGGSSQTIAPVTFARGGSWGRKNVILYAPDPGSGIWRVNADGSNAAPLTDKLLKKDKEDSHRWPLFLSDGDHFLYLGASFGTSSELSNTAIYLSSLEMTEAKRVVEARSNVGYAADQLFWIDDKKSLRVAALNVKDGSVSGNSTVLVDAVGYQPSVYWGAFAVAENGTVVYNKNTAAALSILAWHDRDGKELGRVGEIGVQANPAISPDGGRVAIDITDLRANNLDVWINDLRKGTSTRFTFDPAEETDGVWSRDGTTIAYRSVAGGTGVNLKNANGIEKARQTSAAPRRRKFSGFEFADIVPSSWSVDDKQILCAIQHVEGGLKGSVLALIPASGGDPVPFLSGPASATNGQISPDGKWVAYASNESGDWEVYVTTFPGAAGKWQVSRGGGGEPRWRGDGKEIFYLGPSGTMMAVTVEVGGTFSSGMPVSLFQVRGRAPISSTDLYTYDVSKDGQRFLVNQYVKPEKLPPLTIVQHALAEPPK